MESAGNFTLPEPGDDCDEPAHAVAATIEELFEQHFDFVWRVLRRMGVPESDADDATQRCFVIAARKLGELRAASERAFLFQTALRIASEMRRSRSRRHESGDAMLQVAVDPSPGPDERLERAREREQLDDVLECLPEDLRAVFVLYELEGMTAAGIAALHGIPAGTAASRIRRARAAFDAAVKRVLAKKKGAMR
jgi:RNA polymerase sigma-70 factor, ECF subfamily